MAPWRLVVDQMMLVRSPPLGVAGQQAPSTRQLNLSQVQHCFDIFPILLKTLADIFFFHRGLHHIVS